jgi:hypothetical protein
MKTALHNNNLLALHAAEKKPSEMAFNRWVGKLGISLYSKDADMSKDSALSPKPVPVRRPISGSLSIRAFKNSDVSTALCL